MRNHANFGHKYVTSNKHNYNFSNTRYICDNKQRQNRIKSLLLMQEWIDEWFLFAAKLSIHAGFVIHFRQHTSSG